MKRILVLSLMLAVNLGISQQRVLEVNSKKAVAPIQPTMYGIFFEDINFAADGGLYAELIKNRSFEFADPLMGWEQPNSDRHSYNKESGIAVPVQYMGNPSNAVFAHITINDPKGYLLQNKGFRGMGIHEDAAYRLSFDAKTTASNILHVALKSASGNPVATAKVTLDAGDWKTYEVKFTATATEEKAYLELTFENAGEVDMDMISLFPEDTWNGRKNGMRKDLVQLLYDLEPGFLRFPGGCIVEGRTLAQRYQWKKTVGPVNEREYLINRWNTEFDHRPTPDYFQSFGLGFFEYFQLAEDLGAEALPILSCGMACQFNTGELVPMEELDPYIQDALDLIQFANGSTDTPWGKVRSDMGHPEPFNMKYIGVGNEQWGPDYIERYMAFEKAIKEKYPEIIIVSGSGPFPDGDFFEYGMEQLSALNAEIVDEHYYRSPEWFRENADRYDSYDRNGPKIFAGEYAAQSVAIASPDNKNNWECALSEAAFMTGLERNADVVHLTSYAPLMAHKEGWQWTPDLLWFDNLTSYGTPNYYVQKLFSNNPGKELISVTEKGAPLTGQGDLYASAVKNSEAVIVKLVNTGTKETSIRIKMDRRSKNADVVMETLTAPALDSENSFEDPDLIAPVKETMTLSGASLDVTVKPQSVTVLTVNVK